MRVKTYSMTDCTFFTVAQSVSSSSLYMAGMLQITLPILRNRCVSHLDLFDLSRQKQLLIVKHRNSKWAVSEEEMPGSHYPDFLSGWSVT